MTRRVLDPDPIRPADEPLPARDVALIDEGLRRAERVECFAFVPSSYAQLHGWLAALAPGRYCEWGSGIGIGVGLAAGLGFEAVGVEIHPGLAQASRELLAEFGVEAEILTGSYFELEQEADVYFAYCWPRDLVRTEELFVRTAPEHARLIMAHGASDLRVKRKPPGEASARRGP